MRLNLDVLLRNPIYPVIVFSDTDLCAANNSNDLCGVLNNLYKLNCDKIRIIDNSFEVFIFQEMKNRFIIMPNIFQEKISKKMIVDILFNRLGIKYNRSLANIKIVLN